MINFEKIEEDDFKDSDRHRKPGYWQKIVQAFGIDIPTDGDPLPEIIAFEPDPEATQTVPAIAQAVTAPPSSGTNRVLL